MRRTLTALIVGIVLGIAGTLAAIEVRGGQWEYFILPEGRCHPTGGATWSVAEPVPGAAHPCVFRRPRWSFIN